MNQNGPWNGARPSASVTARAEQLPQLPDVSTVMISAATAFGKRHPRLIGTWAFGVLLCLFATGFAVTHEDNAKFSSILSRIDYTRLQEAEKGVGYWQREYYNSKGWFSCDDLCHENYAKLTAAQANLVAIETEFAAITSEAKQTVGIFSEYGVQEVRDLFWSQFAGGREFAQRSSWYDFIFMSIGSMGRDESLIEFGLRVLLNMLLNFTIGLIGALIGFYYYLWGVISTYEPNFLFAFFFFMLASIAATSVVASYLAGLYSAAAGSVYVAVKIGTQAVRLDDRQQTRQTYIRYQQQARPHES